MQATRYTYQAALLKSLDMDMVLTPPGGCLLVVRTLQARTRALVME